jgi:sulfatase maturation enzyme AslB (radical SAM superfamily)
MKSAYLQIIRICNQDCIFCAQPQNGKILSIPGILKQMIFYKKSGVQKIIITGGEPTLHKDFLKIVGMAYKFGFKVLIQSNGNQFSDEKLVDWLSQFAWLEFIVSLHSHEGAIHDSVKRSPGSFEKTRKWLFFLYNKIPDVTIKIAIALNIYNIESIRETTAFFMETFPFVKWFVLNNLDVYNIPKDQYHIVAKLPQFDDAFREWLSNVLKTGRTINVERVPLCYLTWLEEYADSLEYILWNDMKYVHYLQEDRESFFLDVNIRTPETAYWKNCQSCDLRKICGWIPKLGEIYDENDLHTQTRTKEEFNAILDKYYAINTALRPNLW